MTDPREPQETTRAQRWAEYLNEIAGESKLYENKIDDESPPRYVLVEVSTYDGTLYLTGHDSPEDAADYHDGQEEPGDWPVRHLIDLDTGEVAAATTAITFTTTFGSVGS